MADGYDRQTTVTLTLGDGGGEQLKMFQLRASEGLSRHFHIEVEVITQVEIELLPNIGLPAALEAQTEGEHNRYFHGTVVDAKFLRYEEGLGGDDSPGFFYMFTLKPDAYLHQKGKYFRIFQNKSVMSIITETFERCGILFEAKANSAQRQLTYCVQYGESDFDFASRLMEEYGLYYYYLHEAASHKLIICDKPSSHPALPNSKLTYNPVSASLSTPEAIKRHLRQRNTFVQEWTEIAQSGGEQTFTMRDFDFMAPGSSVESVKTEESAHENDKIEVYDWPGRYWETGDGDTLAMIALEARRAMRVRFLAKSSYMSAQTGHTFKLAEHHHDRFNRGYMIVELKTTIAAEQYRSGIEATPNTVAFTCIPDDTQYRAPQTTPRPVARGPETAVVTGPEGEEIWVDEYGRIKVQFHWDRDGKKDDKSSCWIRVTQHSHLGTITHPRIGHEVLVEFIGGNPDRPIVVGSVYNAGHKPVYELPKHKTKSLWRTKTYKEDKSVAMGVKKLDTKDPGANELRFEDATGEEELFIHAEKDMNIRVRDNETHHIGTDQAIEIGQDRTETVDRDEKVHIKGDREKEVGDKNKNGNEKIKLHGNQEQEILGNREVDIRGSDELKIGQSLEIDVGTTIHIKANQKITIEVGGTSITMDPTSLKAMTTLLTAQGTGTATLKSGGQTTVEASGLVTVKGGMVMIN